MAGKKQRPYEYARALKYQSPEVQAMITAGEKEDEKKAAAKKAVAKKKKRERELWVLKRAKKRLKKVFKPKPLPNKSRYRP